MKFSVIVVSYNAGNKLLDTVDNILEQSFPNLEIIIKDGMSTDYALTRLPIDEKLRVTSCKDQGIYDAMNQAIRLAEGDYYIFMNCGDTFYDEWVLEKAAHKIEAMQMKSKERLPLIFYGDTYDEVGKNIVTMNQEITPFTCYRHIPCHQACLYAAELFKERQYDLQYRIRADYEHFLWSYFVKDARPYHLGLTIANYEGGGFSETRENRTRDREEHRKITEQYIPRKKLLKYRMIMVLTLAPLRRVISRQRWLSGIYNRVKQVIYRDM